MLELSGSGRYCERVDYNRKPSRIVTLSASVLKMPASARGMAASGHDAIFLRGFDDRDIPIGVFGVLTATPNLYQIKPYAIWR